MGVGLVVAFAVSLLVPGDEWTVLAVEVSLAEAPSSTLLDTLRSFFSVGATLRFAV